MRKLHVFGLAIVAVLALGALIAAPALAVSKILANGAEITATLAVSVEGELVLHNLSNGAEILCSGIFDGSISSGGVNGSITEVLMLDKTLLAENTTNLAGSSVAGDDVECTSIKLCENATSLVVAFGLPWATSVVLVGAEYRLKFPTTSGYNAECRVLGVTVKLACDGAAVEAKLFNDATTGDLMGEFAEGIGPEGSCSDGSTATLRSDAPAAITDADGALLTVSE